MYQSSLRPALSHRVRLFTTSRTLAPGPCGGVPKAVMSCCCLTTMDDLGRWESDAHTQLPDSVPGLTLVSAIPEAILHAGAGVASRRSAQPDHTEADTAAERRVAYTSVRGSACPRRV